MKYFVEPLLTQTLECVGFLNPILIDDTTTNDVVILKVSGFENTFYCAVSVNSQWPFIFLNSFK